MNVLPRASRLGASCREINATVGVHHFEPSRSLRYGEKTGALRHPVLKRENAGRSTAWELSRVRFLLSQWRYVSFYLLFRQSESAQLACNRFDTVLFFIRHVTQLHTEPHEEAQRKCSSSHSGLLRCAAHGRGAEPGSD